MTTVPLTSIGPGPSLSGPGPITLHPGDTTWSNWVPAYRARTLQFKNYWTAGAGETLTVAVEFSDGASAILQGDKFFAACNGIGLGLINPAVDGKSGYCEYSFGWPFVCPFLYARARYTAPGGGADIDGVEARAQEIIDGTDLVTMSNLEILASGSVGPGNVASNWFDAARAMGVVIVQKFAAGPSLLTGVRLLMSDDQVRWFDDQAMTSLGGSGYGTFGAYDTYTDTPSSCRGFAGAGGRGFPNEHGSILPCTSLRTIVALSGAKTMSLNAYLWSQP